MMNLFNNILKQFCMRLRQIALTLEEWGYTNKAHLRGLHSAHLYKMVLKQLRAAVLSSLIAIALWLGIVPQAQAAITSTPAATTESKRIQAVAACLPAKLTIQQDTNTRIANALSEMKNDQLERIFDVTDTPKLSDSEIEFKTCLQQKGFTPQAELQNRSFY